MTTAPDRVTRAITRYLSRQRTRGHYDRSDQLAGRDPVAYAHEVLALRRREVARWREWWGADAPSRPAHVLDVGCGPGFVTLALAEAFPGAEVTGLDVEDEALEVGRALSVEIPAVRWVNGSAEELEAGPFDLVVCRTVLEHVRDPRASLGRMIDALAPGGALFLEAPNYLCPREPHLGLWMLPRSPKALLRLECRLTGRDPGFVDHLQLGVDARTVPRWAAEHPGVRVRDLAAEKARRLLAGRDRAATPGRRRVVDALARLPGAATVVPAVVRALPVWPNVQLMVVRQSPRAP